MTAFAVAYWLGVLVLAACIVLVVLGIGRLVALWRDIRAG